MLDCILPCWITPDFVNNGNDLSLLVPSLAYHLILDYVESSNVGDDKGLQMALGNLDINTMKRIDDFSPDKPLPQVSNHNIDSWWSKWIITFHLEQLCKSLFSPLNPAVTAGTNQQHPLGLVFGAETSSHHLLPHPNLLPPKTGLPPLGGRRESSAWTVWGCPAESFRLRDHVKVSCEHAGFRSLLPFNIKIRRVKK